MNNLKYLRKKFGMSQAELGAKLGVCQQAVGKWERGESYPKFSLTPQIANALGCSIDELFANENNSNEKTVS